MTLRQPRGVIAAIVPFNYPAELWAHKIAAGLAAGNAVITKPPEECPLTIGRIAALFEAAGLPRGAHQVITGLGEVVGAALVRSPGVHMISMTGSTEAGRQILRDAADSLKKVHLELGGNDATIVCEDADVQETAAALVAGRFTSGNGQKPGTPSAPATPATGNSVVIPTLLEKDEATGQTFLRVPLPSKQLVDQALQLLGGLLQGFKK